MKRKLLVLAIAVVMVLSCFMLVSCGDTVKNKLSYGKKYLYEDYLGTNDKEIYYLFNRNGTGEYYSYYQEFDSYTNETHITSYTIYFKYVIDTDNDVVYCFYDSFEYNKDHNYDDRYYTPNPTWSAVLTYTNKFLYSITAYPRFYLTEDFANNSVPNFRR